MSNLANTTISRAAETKARIINEAQIVFSDKGYSNGGLREIAERVGVAPSLVVKYFKSKARLFEEALIAAIIPIDLFQSDRPNFGDAIMRSILDPDATMSASAMIALALGDQESRDIATRVVVAHIINPMAQWLGSDAAHAQALNIFMVTTGFAIFSRNIVLDLQRHHQVRRCFDLCRGLAVDRRSDRTNWLTRRS